MKKFIAVFNSRNKEFIRDRAAFGWSLAFPILVVFGFAFTFSKGSQDVFKVAVVSEPQGQISPLGEFRKVNYIQFIDQTSGALTPGTALQASLQKLKRHQVDLVVSEILESGSHQYKYWINSTSPKGYLLEKILIATQTPQVQYVKQAVEGAEIRYVDWLIAGLLSMNMMFSALFGVGYNIVRYRQNGVLKRLKATPLSAFEFLFAQVVSRLLVILVMTSFVYLGSHLFIHFQMQGSYLDLFIVMFMGAFCLISLSLMVAARISSEEFAGGLLNLISWPMMFLSGVWFSLEGAHPWVRGFAQIFPLTHVIDAARAIMTEGAGLAEVSVHVIVLALMSLIFLTVGSLTFKWK